MAIIVNKDNSGIIANGATANIDRPYSSPNRKQAGTPLATTTPLYSGEIIQDTTAGTLWYALGLTSADWISVQVEG